MNADEETLARIRTALANAERVDSSRVEVGREGQEVVLRGAVATPEEATVAALLAERDAARVRSELHVDAGLREATSAGAALAPGTPDPAPQRSPEDPTQPADDLTSSVEEALGENIAWDPPDAPSFAPTRAEQRSVPAGDRGEPGEGGASTPDLSAAERTRAARRHEREDNEMHESRARALLEAERERLLGLRHGHTGSQLEQSLTESTSELSVSGQHPGDVASDTTEREKDLWVLEHLDTQLQEVEAAFQRLEEGRYGICEGTGEPIPDERLEAEPAARYIVAYQAQLERGSPA